MPALIGFFAGIIFSTLPVLHFIGEGLANAMGHGSASATRKCMHHLERLSGQAPMDMLLLLSGILFLIGGLYWEHRSKPRTAKSNSGFIFAGIVRFSSVVFSVLWCLLLVVVLLSIATEYVLKPGCL